eukprot:gene9206-10180_t
MTDEHEKKVYEVNFHGQGTIATVGDNNKIFATQVSVCRSPPPESVQWIFQEPVKSFTGREHEIELLHKKLTQGDEEKTHRQIVIADADNVARRGWDKVAVTGLGGTGKTELARKYAYRYGPEFFENNIVWINAEDEGSLRKAFSDIAAYMNIETLGQNNKVKIIVKRVYDCFKNRKVLFIFDNAESMETIKDFLPVYWPGCESPYVLLTSRNRDWGHNVAELELDMLSRNEAIEFICKCLRDSNGNEVAEVSAGKLADKLHCFPLALQQAVSYIKKYKKRTKFEIDHYLAAFDKKTKELLNFRIPYGPYEKTVFITWNITFDKIRESNKLAIDILGMMAYMHADDIPRSTFIKLAKDDEDALWEALELLEQYSLIKKRSNLEPERGCDVNKECEETEHEMYSIHRLVQDVVRLRNTQPDSHDHDEYLDKVLEQMKTYVRGELGHTHNDRKFVYHAMMAVEHCCGSEKNYALLEKYCYVPVKVVDALLCRAQYEEAFDFATKQHDFALIHLGEHHHATLALQYNMARTLHRLGEDDKSLKEFDAAIKNFEKSLGSLHADTLVTRMDLAFCYVDLNEPRKALELFEDIYEKQKSAEKSEQVDSLILYPYRDSLSVLNGIGHCQMLLKDYHKAENYFQEVYDKRGTRDGEKHPITLYIGNKLGEAYIKQRKFDEGLGILRHIYKAQVESKEIGENYAHTLSTERNIIDALVLQDKLEEARDMLIGLRDKKTVSLGPNHKIVLDYKKRIEELFNKKDDEAVSE